MAYTLVIHGGAGNITPAIMNAQQEAEYTAALKVSLEAGTKLLVVVGRVTKSWSNFSKTTSL